LAVIWDLTEAQIWRNFPYKKGKPQGLIKEAAPTYKVFKGKTPPQKFFAEKGAPFFWGDFTSGFFLLRGGNSLVGKNNLLSLRGGIATLKRIHHSLESLQLVAVLRPRAAQLRQPLCPTK